MMPGDIAKPDLPLPERSGCFPGSLLAVAIVGVIAALLGRLRGAR